MRNIARRCGNGTRLPSIVATKKRRSSVIRMCQSVAFYLGREDVTWYRSKEIDKLRQVLRENPRTAMLLAHRHSLAVLGQAMPPELELRQLAHFGLPPVPGVPPSWGKGLAKTFGETVLGLADLAVVQRRQVGFEAAEPLEQGRAGAAKK